MKLTPMLLTDTEVRLVTAQRESVQWLAIRTEKQKSCDHDWRFGGHGHNDSWYDCTKCGASKEV